MRFWDSSAVIPFLVREPRTEQIARFARDDFAVWWASRTECVSAVARLEREGALTGTAAGNVLAGLYKFFESAAEVQPTEQVRARAERLLRIHPLRAADAFQLGAALTLFGEESRGREFLTFDDRLRTAAEREGFTVPI